MGRRRSRVARRARLFKLQGRPRPIAGPAPWTARRRLVPSGGVRRSAAVMRDVCQPLNQDFDDDRTCRRLDEDGMASSAAACALIVRGASSRRSGRRTCEARGFDSVDDQQDRWAGDAGAALARDLVRTSAGRSMTLGWCSRQLAPPRKNVRRQVGRRPIHMTDFHEAPETASSRSGDGGEG